MQFRLSNLAFFVLVQAIKTTTVASVECGCNVDDTSSKTFKCGNQIYVCPGVERVCSVQESQNSVYYAITQDQCDAMQTVEIGDTCIDLSQHDNKPKGLSNRVCYSDEEGSNGFHGMKEDGSCGVCNDSIVPPIVVETVPPIAPPIIETIAPTVRVTVPVTDNNNNNCAPVALDFNELSAGSYIHDELWEARGVKITAKKWRDSDRNGFTPDASGNHLPQGGAARVFDTTNPVCDDDLGAPHKDFNGPGKGCGGGEFLMEKTDNGSCEYVYDNMGNRQENPWKNDKPLGNVLIIQESDKDCPDDSADGGTITFDFKQPTTINLAKLLDVDESASTPDIVITYGSDGGEKTINVDATGDNGLWSEQLNEDDVIKVEVKFWGSGSIAELNYYDFINCDDKEEPPADNIDGNNECGNSNLGYGFSEAMHDTNLGNNHYGQDDDSICYPPVHSLGSGVSGNDDAVAVLVGGSFYGERGSEIEGNMVVMGDFHVDQNGPSNFASAGEGTQITPHKGGDCITVGGDMSSAKRLEIYYPHYQCTAIVKGQQNDYGTIAPTWMTESGFRYEQDSNLDMTKYEQQIDSLRGKSLYWASLPTTQGTTAGVSSQAFNIECTGDDVIQVFNIPATSLQGNGYSSYVFNKYCSNKTILINVQGTGSVTYTTRHMKWTDENNKVQNGGWSNFPSCMNSAILWNFPNAIDVLVNGSDELQGSLLVNGNLNFQSAGQSGRTMVLGNLIINQWGSEFHSFEFKPPTPLPDPECEEVPDVVAPTQAPQSPTDSPTKRPTKKPTDAPTMEPTNPPTKDPTKSPTFAPVVPITEPPTGSLEENGGDDDDSDDTFLLPSCPEDIRIVRKLGVTDFPAERTPAVEIVSQDTSTVTVALKQKWSTEQSSLDSIFYQYKDTVWAPKCYEQTDVAGGDNYDTITITCNIMSPFAYLEICVVDELSNGILLAEDDGTIPKCCHSEVPPEDPVVCYSLEIRCTSICIEEAPERKLRGSKK